MAARTDFPRVVGSCLNAFFNLSVTPGSATDPMSSCWARAMAASAAAVAATAHFWSGANDAASRELADLFQQIEEPAVRHLPATWLREAWRARQRGHATRAMLASRRGDDLAALRDFLAAHEWAQALGDAKMQARSLTNLGNVYLHVGLEARALALYRQALAPAQALAMDELLPDIHHNIGAALAGCGETEASIASHRLAQAELARLGAHRKRPYPLAGICEGLLRLGRIDEAVAVLREVDALVGEQAEVAVRSYAAYLGVRVALAQRNWPRAGQAAAAALAFARQHGLRSYEGQALQDLARIAIEQNEFDAARRHAQEALASFTASSMQPGVEESHGLLGRIAEASGDWACALAHFKRSHQLQTELAAERSAAQTKILMVEYEVERAHAEAELQRLENARLTEALAQIGERLRAGAAATTGSSSSSGSARPAAATAAQPQDLMALGLTRREAEVLYWVAQGKTNAEVVTILGTGLPAVKKHMGRIFEKLGVDNRTAAAAAVRQPPRGVN